MDNENQATKEKRLLTFNEVCKRTNRSRRGLYDIIEAGALKSVRQGRNRMFWEHDVEEYLNSLKYVE